MKQFINNKCIPLCTLALLLVACSAKPEEQPVQNIEEQTTVIEQPVAQPVPPVEKKEAQPSETQTATPTTVILLIFITLSSLAFFLMMPL